MDGHYLCADFVGMISVMMVKDSWVARWNEIMPNAQPGVYAINVPQPAYDEYANMMGKKQLNIIEHADRVI